MWTDKHVLVTGAASGIGRALAAAFTDRGARLTIADVNAEGLAAVAGALGATPVTCDVADRGQVEAMFAAAAATHGPIDLVCSNAGIGRNKAVLATTDANLELLFAVNFRSALSVAQTYAAQLAAQNHAGRILFTASENSLSLPDAVREMRLGPYAATKHALLILVEWMREEFRGGPLAPALLFPGPVLTEPFRAAMDSGRFGQGMDPARKAAFEAQLITPEACAARAISGLERGLFYIPTHAHLRDDMQDRIDELDAAFAAMRDLY
ncbi:MAG: SDR family oxidoreductase [Alphaproteobacteria bacterium]|nr:SDR family oxidoreductase [Alphaproteobacteria bacterium]